MTDPEKQESPLDRVEARVKELVASISHAAEYAASLPYDEREAQEDIVALVVRRARKAEARIAELEMALVVEHDIREKAEKARETLDGLLAYANKYNERLIEALREAEPFLAGYRSITPSLKFLKKVRDLIETDDRLKQPINPACKTHQVMGDGKPNKDCPLCYHD
jgi:hypothetical protein